MPPISRDLIHSLLQDCTKKKDFAAARHVHSLMILSGLHHVGVLGDHLIRLFASSGSLLDANLVFCNIANPSVHTWHAIISTHTMLGRHDMALQLYHYMHQHHINPDKFVFSCILKACSYVKSIHEGRLLHGWIARSGLESDVVVGSTLVDMYAKCGSLNEARHVFDNLPHRNVVSWSAIISGYVYHEQGLPALELFERMMEEAVKPDDFIFSCALKASGSIGAMLQGMHIHHEVIRSGLDLDMVIGNTLVDMYAKCGSLLEADKVLDKLPSRNVVSWSAMIAGYARYGKCNLAGQCLGEMLRHGLKPDGGMYISILAACCHAGEVKMGCRYFKAMIVDHGLTPGVEHINCMIDLLGRAGCIKEAEEFLRTMPIALDIYGWRSLLTACRIHGDTELGRKCFDVAVQLEPHHAAGYVLMASMCGDAAYKRDDAKSINKIKQYSCKAWI